MPHPRDVKVTLSLAVLAALGLLGGCMAASSPSARPTTYGQPPTFTPDELELLRALWIGSLPPLPDDPSNRYADDLAAASLGESIFFDAQFSANGDVSCSSCHQPELAFTDGLPRGRGIGETPRSTMSVLGAAYAPFLFWDGRKDSLWAQALGPLENALEHGGNRGMYAHVIADHYRAEYEAIFGPLPDLSDTERFPPSAGPVDDPAGPRQLERHDPGGSRCSDRHLREHGQGHRGLRARAASHRFPIRPASWRRSWAAAPPAPPRSPTRRWRACACSSVRRTAPTATTGRSSRNNSFPQHGRASR